MIICNLTGGFGNHLLCYFLGCILAEKLNKKIYINSNAIKNDSLSQRKDTRETIYKVVNIQYISNKFYKNKDVKINSFEEYLNILNRKLDDYLLNSNFIIDIIGADSLSFYIDYLDIIKKYIILNNRKNENSIVISLRLGMGTNEVAQPSPFENELRLPFEYYKKAIEYFTSINKNINKLIICSDNFTDDFICNFKIYNNLNIIFCSDKNTLEQFEYIVSADYFISSNSTFSLVGAILNTSGITTIPNFKESNAVYPGKNNSRYSDVLNINSNNCVKILL
jgi:hypothetical protein